MNFAGHREQHLVCGSDGTFPLCARILESASSEEASWAVLAAGMKQSLWVEGAQHEMIGGDGDIYCFWNEASFAKRRMEEDGVGRHQSATSPTDWDTMSGRQPRHTSEAKTIWKAALSAR